MVNAHTGREAFHLKTVVFLFVAKNILSDIYAASRNVVVHNDRGNSMEIKFRFLTQTRSHALFHFEFQIDIRKFP